ncbi:MAG: tyrosine-protein phosphatase [Coriobacteriia bacterium]|nr:tyrosine-protein phosphatase [Coriobacteriia bacterium]
MNIDLEKIFNARDLGGMKGADGKTIKPKRLIRSSCLHGASKKDAKILVDEFNLKNVVDFRYQKEREEKPHPKRAFKKVKYYSLPSFETIVKAFTRDEESMKLLNNQGEFTEESAVKFIETFYRWLPTEQSVQDAYTQFLKILLDTKEGSTLWHCSLGKDRAGMAAVIVEKILGVSAEDILADYMETNNHMDPTVDMNKANAFRAFYGTCESFLENWYKSIDET